LNFQGLIADIEHSQNKLILGSNEVKQVSDKVQRAYRQASAAGISILEQRKLASVIAELENELFEQVPSLKFSPIQVADIAKVLPANSVLVEFQKYGKFPKQNRVYFSDQEKYYYVAITLDSTGAVQRFDLGPAEVIDKAIAKASYASSEGLSDVNERWADVSKLIMAPLRETFSMTGEMFISPDSELNRVPFAALPSPFSSGFLVDRVRLRVLTSGRDLMALSKRLDQQSKSSVVIANPSFDVAEGTIERAQNSLPLTRSASIDPIRKEVRWAPLPATAKEGSAIASLLSAKLVHSAQATPMFVQGTIGPKIIHIASHGYFVGEQQSNESIRDTNLFTNGYGLGESSNSGQGLIPNRINPLLKSGIVLAGANQPTTNPDDDGYLTALEVSRLQLNGTELFVVSACASGQGDVQTGEGVYGLSRAIAVAGARSSLLSLWKVDDAATADFMIRFYKRLKAGEGRSDALAAVQKEFRDGTAGSGQWKEPYYWAAWQLVGDWRPIKGL
jgi:CHAT domain-containing protein